MSTTEQMLECPACHSQVNENAKFCPECGAGLTPRSPETAWIVAMQEKIKNAKENNLTFTIFGTFGAAVAIVVSLVMRFVLRQRMDTISWLFIAAGILFFIGGYFGTWYNDRKVKKLIKQLENGQQ